MASESGWGTINGRTARRLEDGWIVVKDTHLRECHVRMNRAPLDDTRVATLQAEVNRGYLNDDRPRSDMDGFSMWRSHP